MNFLPEKFEVKLSELTEIGQSITLADLDFNKSKVSLVEVENEEDWEKPVILVQEQRQEEVIEAVEEVDIDEEEGVEKTDQATEEKSDAEKTEDDSAKKE